MKSVIEREAEELALKLLREDNKKLREALKYAVDVLQTIEMAYDDRKDEKLDLDDIKELAGYLLETIKKALAASDENKR